MPRPAVGARVVLCPGADPSRCLGDPALRRVGVLVRDDHDANPFKVRNSDGVESFYTEDAIREA